MMTDHTGNTPSREERLAAKLRENLRRRKAQARAMPPEPPGSATVSGADGLSKSGADS